MLSPVFTIAPEILRLIGEMNEFEGWCHLIRSLSPSYPITKGKPSTVKLRLK